MLLHMNRLNKAESAIFVSVMCSLLPEDLHSELIIIPREIVPLKNSSLKNVMFCLHT